MVALRARSIAYAAVLATRPLGVDIESVLGDGRGAYLAHDLHHLVVTIDGIGEVLGSRSVSLALRIVILLERHHTLHHGVRKLTLESVVILIKILHDTLYRLLLLMSVMSLSTVCLASPTIA